MSGVVKKGYQKGMQYSPMATAVKTSRKSYRTLLLKKRQEIQASTRFEPEALSANIRTADSVEFAIKAADQDVVAATANLRFRLLREIDGALDRVKIGTYGICEMCGEEISANRLRALPWARYCLSCEEQRSKN